MAAASQRQRQFIEVMAKHLPPSGASLRLLDVAGRAGDLLHTLRPDIDVVLAPGEEDNWLVNHDSLDAVVAYNCDLTEHLLVSALAALRPGGRLIVMKTKGKPAETQVKTLEQAGFARILVEPGLNEPKPSGVLMRGEKPHTEATTVDRAKQVAGRDPGQRQARYIHLLIHQTPHKPAWRRQPSDKIEWQAAAVEGDNETVVLAFTSLPKAVEFMQPAVMEGHITEVNKIAKFQWQIARDWPFPMLLNPSDEIFATQKVTWQPIDPQTAEAADE